MSDDDEADRLQRPLRGFVTGVLFLCFGAGAAVAGAATGGAPGAVVYAGLVLWLFVDAYGGRRLTVFLRVAGVYAFAALVGLGALAWHGGEGDRLAPVKAAAAALIGAGVAGAALLADAREER